MRLKRKIPSFVFGVSVGLVIGAAFFAFKITDVFNRIKDTAIGQVTVIERPVKASEPSENKKKDRERFKIDLRKSAKVNYKEVDSLLAEDNGVINIATDELLSVKNLKVIRLGDNISARDTAAAHLAQIDEPVSDLYFIEFWKTPLNSRGYRFSKNKVMLYGFQDANNLLLYQLDNSFYLKSDERVFRLVYGGDFRPLERVVDAVLLAKMN